MIRVCTTVVLLLMASAIYGQEGSGDKSKIKSDGQWLSKTALKNVEVNILASYYTQDGNKSVVTGGQGSEDLQDTTPAIIINIPVDSTRQWSVNFGIDIVTSASTDNIDFNVSSDSRKDSRKHLAVTYTKRLSRQRLTYSYSAGLSKEYDVFSKSIGASITKESLDGNREISLNGQAFFDAWKIYEPYELRLPNSGDGEENDNRNSYNLGLTYSQILTKRLQLSLSAEIVLQEGLLSTPFHRAFFNDGISTEGLTTNQILLSNKTRKIENLPRSRTRIPLGFRLNYYASDLFVFRAYYRYYKDDFDIEAHTFSLDIPVKISPFLSITPFYRYHTQTASKYYQPFGEHDLNAEFFTSDPDQSGLNSNKFGIGIRYSPLDAIGILRTPFTKKSKNSFSHLKSIELRYAYFDRSNGLTAAIISVDLAFDLIKAKRK